MNDRGFRMWLASDDLQDIIDHDEPDEEVEEEDGDGD